MYLKKAIFINRAPLGDMTVDFGEKGINVLTAINGKGKTTIITYVFDALYEMAKRHYSQSFRDSNSFYRFSSDIFSTKPSEPSMVYLRFVDNAKNIDYVDLRGAWEEGKYNAAIESLPNTIEFKEFSKSLANNGVVKHVVKSFNKKEVHHIFEKHVLTYFPAYRFEQPAYLTDLNEIKTSFNDDLIISNKLRNNLEVRSVLPDIVNWIMDVVLDELVNKSTGDKKDNILHQNINRVLQHILSSKEGKSGIRFGISRRVLSGTRLSIVRHIGRKITDLTPSIYTLSSGELSLMCIFAEILRQADNLKIGTELKDITGIVLIDEIDLHLHIKLQKETLPQLFGLFPNVQFIVSSHSPFLNMGLNDCKEPNYQIIDLDNGGISVPVSDNGLYKEVYELMIEENNRYARQYKDLKSRIEKENGTLIVTEGETDVNHLKAAAKHLDLKDFLDGMEFMDIPDSWGSSKVIDLWEKIQYINPNRVVIFIIDRDESTLLKKLGTDDKPYRKSDIGNCYIFAIPLVNDEEYETNNISIEHYYKKNDLLKKDANGRRLFLGKEFYNSGNSVDGQLRTKISGIQNKVKINGIIDEKVYSINDLEEQKSVALSKMDFSRAVLGDEEFSRDFDFSSFNRIFDVIKQILKDAKGDI